jgi:hypothetical protein
MLYVLYKIEFCNKEKFQSTTSGYQADVEAIRNLSSIATQLTTNNTLTMPGALNITNELSVKTGDPGKQVKIGSSQIKFRGDGIVHYGLTNDKDGKFKISNLSGSADIGYGFVNDCITTDSIGNTTINGNLNKKENRARYIRIGNKEVPELRQDYWWLIEAKIYNSDSTNIALNKPVSILEGAGMYGLPPGNITNGRIFPNNNNNVLADNINLGYHGNTGVNVLQIDLGSNNYISQIELYNRCIDYAWRMDGTTIELFDESGARNRIIYTGLWDKQYSKTFLL